MKFSVDKFKQDIVQNQESGIIDQALLQSYLKDFYNQGDPIYPTNPPYDIVKIREQAKMVCDRVTSFGMTKFQDLMDKFSFSPGNETDANIMCDIKVAMESILYKMAVSTDPAALASQYNDHNFVCKEGTLTNLQSILASLSLARSDLNAYLVEQKISLLSAIAMDLRRQRKFNAPVYSTFSFLEVHHIPALVDSLADEYSLQKKSEHDRWAPNINSIDKDILAKSVADQLGTELVTNAFVDSVAASVVYNLPHFKETTYNADITEHLELLKLDDGILNPYTLSTTDKGCNPTGYKPHIELIIKNGITLYLAQKGIIDCPDLELIKLKIEAENLVATGGIDEDTINDAAAKGCLNEFIKYTTKYKIPMERDPDNSLAAVQYGFSLAASTESSPLVWAFRQEFKIGDLDIVSDAIVHNKKIDGYNPWQWMMRNLANHEISQLIQDNIDKLNGASAIAMHEAASPENRNIVLSAIFRSYYELNQIGDADDTKKDRLEVIYNTLVRLDNGFKNPLGHGSKLKETLVKKANAFFKRLESEEGGIATVLRHHPEESYALTHLLDLQTLYLLISKRESFSGLVIPVLDKSVSEENFKKCLSELQKLELNIQNIHTASPHGSVSSRASTDSASDSLDSNRSSDELAPASAANLYDFLLVACGGKDNLKNILNDYLTYSPSIAIQEEAYREKKENHLKALFDLLADTHISEPQQKILNNPINKSAIKEMLRDKALKYFSTHNPSAHTDKSNRTEADKEFYLKDDASDSMASFITAVCTALDKELPAYKVLHDVAVKNYSNMDLDKDRRLCIKVGYALADTLIATVSLRNQEEITKSLQKKIKHPFIGSLDYRTLHTIASGIHDQYSASSHTI